jgi:hypothetical protein
MIGIRQRSVRVLVSGALLSSGLGALALVGSPAAHADPSYEVSGQPYVGVGSDTLQDLFNAFSGAEPSIGAQPTGVANLPTAFYTPLHSSAATGSLTPTSFDALNPHLPFANPPTGDFVTTKINGPTFDRPNGSGDGRTALADAINGTLWSNVNGPASSVTGQLDFARSSSLGSSAVAGNVPASTLSYIPIASDGVGYAFHCANPASADCATLAKLPSSVLKALYIGNGTLAAASWGATADTLDACAIQTGSGTFKFFLTQIGSGISPATAQTNLSASGGSNCTGLEENNLNAFLAASPGPGAAAANTDWIIPTSVGNDSAQHNKLALNRSSNFWNANGTDVSGDGVAPVADAFSTKLNSAISAGATSISIGLQAPVGSTLTIGPDSPNPAENVTVTSVTGTNPYTVGISATTSAHAVNAPVSIAFTFPYLGDGTATWSPNTSYFASNFGRWLFVVVSSTKIAGRGIDQALADLFYSPNATGGTAALCQASAKTTVGQFGFDASLPDNGSAHQQGGTCGTVAFTGTN